MKTYRMAIFFALMMLWVSPSLAVGSEMEKGMMGKGMMEKGMMKGGMMMCMPTAVMGEMMTMMCSPMEDMHMSDEMKSGMGMKQGEMMMKMGEMMMKKGEMMMEKNKKGMMKK